MKTELTKIATKHKVSYDWSGGKGLTALIIGAARLATDYPHLAPFVEPVIPHNTPQGLGANPTQAQVRVATDENNLAKRDWAVVCGFRRGASELIRNALDSEYYDDLDHVQYGYDDVLPRDFIEHLKDEHCPLDEQAVKDARKHYFRGWERSKSPRPEGIKKFAKRLDEEQTALGRDGIAISDADKKAHYLVEVFQSGVFPAVTVDPTMLMALSSIASEQASPTQKTLERTLFFLDYVASHPDAVLTYKASNMVLHVHSDASYLSEPKAKSRAGGHFFHGRQHKTATE